MCSSSLSESAQFNRCDRPSVFPLDSTNEEEEVAEEEGEDDLLVNRNHIVVEDSCSDSDDSE